MGTALAQSGKPEEAEKVLSEAARLDPSESRAWFNLGVLREDRGDPKGAADAYESLLKNVKNGDPDGKLHERIAALRAQGSAAPPPPR